MNSGSSGPYDRKLQAALVARLERGVEPDALLEELKTRLDDDAAEAALAQAEARHRGPAPASPTIRLLAGLAYAWTVLLAIQNLMILSSLAALPSYPRSDAEMGFYATLIGLTLAKVGLLIVGVFAFKRWRSVATATVYALAILFAFPFGVYANALLLSGAEPEPTNLLSLSAMCSYAAAALVAAVWWLGRQATKPAIVLDQFD